MMFLQRSTCCIVALLLHTQNNALASPPTTTTTTASRNEGLRRALLAPKPETLYSDSSYMPPNVQVDYGGNHKFEQRRRRLFSEETVHTSTLEYSTSTAETATATEDDTSCNPIRIRFVTDALEARRGESTLIDEQIDFLLTKTLPSLASTWASHLSLSSVQGNIPLSKDMCFGHFENSLHDNLLDRGVADADLVIIVSGTDVFETNLNGGEQWSVCPARRIAFASICALDQFDRPIVGFINFCLPLLSLEQDGEAGDENEDRQRRRRRQQRELEEEVVEEEEAFPQHNYGNALRYTHDEEQDTLRIALHESAHVLGMDSSLVKYFRNSTTGLPLTNRPFIPRTAKCVDGESRVTIMPSPQTVAQNFTSRGLVYYDLITPKVTTVARNHFNCPDIQGIRLENQNVGSGCFGSHLDERLYFTEIMGARYSGEVDILSPLTLAFMEDTGWYKASYEGISMSPFGTGMGCDFVFGDCIIDDQVADWGKDVFCDTASQFNSNNELTIVSDTNAVYSWNPIVCDPSHTAFAVCNLFDEKQIPEDMVESLEFDNIDPIRYFNDQDIISSFAEGDYCPLPIRDVGVDCTTSTDYTPIYLGEKTGPASRCVNAKYDTDSGNQVARAACLPVICDEESKKVVIGQGALAKVCDYDGQVHDWTNDVYMECPRLSTICPHFFCPASCSGRGHCDWEAQPTPLCRCFDQRDFTDGCYGSNSPTSTPVQAALPTLRPPTAYSTPTSSPVFVPSDTSPEDQVVNVLKSNAYGRSLFATAAWCTFVSIIVYGNVQ